MPSALGAYVFEFFVDKLCSKSDEKLTKKMYFLAILLNFGRICIYIFSSNVSFIQVVKVNHIVAMDLIVSSFMSTNNVRKVTKNSRKKCIFSRVGQYYAGYV